MIDTIYATKKGMSQAWDVNGKRLPITKFLVEQNVAVGAVETQVRTDKKNVAGWAPARVIEIGYGAKKLKNMSKPMRSRLEKLQLNQGVRVINGVREHGEDKLEVGSSVDIAAVLKVGDIVAVQGTTKGRGFAGGMKRHGFRGGPKTHGQSDRWRAVGSVGNRTTPGRVWLGKRLPGHMGVTTKTVTGLVVAHFDPESRELWLTGPVPGAFGGIVAITNSGKTKKNFALDKKASGLSETVKAEAAPEVQKAAAPADTTTDTGAASEEEAQKENK